MAIVCARRVLPLPVDPNIMMLDFSSFSWWLVASRISEPCRAPPAAPGPEPELEPEPEPAFSSGAGPVRGSGLLGLKPTPRAEPIPAM